MFYFYFVYVYVGKACYPYLLNQKESPSQLLISSSNDSKSANMVGAGSHSSLSGCVPHIFHHIYTPDLLHSLVIVVTSWWSMPRAVFRK